MTEDERISWLLSGDVAVQYQVYRDLLGNDRDDLHARIAQEGWGARFLSLQRPDGHWGKGFYQPKWISTHYTLLDLRHLELRRDHPAPRKAVDRILAAHKSSDGGVSPHRDLSQSDVCVNGMFLLYACYFGAAEAGLRSIIDYLFNVHMPDGGFNCNSTRGGAVHSSLHTTISILEGLNEYQKQGYAYRAQELKILENASREFILQHRLFRSDKTGEVINKRFLMLSFPSRWFFNILRALEYFYASATPYDERMKDALDVLTSKRRKDGTWPVQAKHTGLVHFDMEATGKPSRWNTLRAMRVLRYYAWEA